MQGVMSRRKQSNPKPIKRPNDEDEDGDMTQQIQSNNGTDEPDGQSDASSHTDTEQEPMEMDETKNKEEITPSESPPIKEAATVGSETENQSDADRADQDMSPRRQEVMNKLCFPSDLLTLRKVDESEFLQTGIPWSVSTAIQLTKGTNIGPYQGELVALSSIKPGELVLQFQSGSGEFAFIKVTEESGAWLALLKPAESPTVHNTCVYFEGDQIWCETVDDLPQGTELTASFTTNTGQQSASASRGKSGKLSVSVPGRNENKSQRIVGRKSDAKSSSQVSPQPALIYGCPFCGVRFSSPRTLEAHITYYCSKKPPDLLSFQQLQARIAQASAHSPGDTQTAGGQQPQEAPSPTSEPEVRESSSRKRPMSENCESHSGSDSPPDVTRPPPKSPKTGETYKCTSCDYVTDRMSSLNRHKRMHVRNVDVEEQMSVDRMSVSPQCLSEMYCKYCKIQFTSMSTYNGHREFYCQFKNLHKDNSDDAVSEGASPAMEQKSPSGSISAGESSLSPKMLGMHSVIANSNKGMLFNKGLLSIHPTMVMPSLLESPLLLHAISQDMKKLERYADGRNESSQKTLPNIEESPINERSELIENQLENDQPLDLSTSKPKPYCGSGTGVFNHNEATRDTGQSDSTSARSEPSSPQKNPVEKKETLSDEQETGDSVRLPSKPTLNIPNIQPALAKLNQIPFGSKAKPVPPLALVSRCVECNIVFYKHENYLIHKEHYCSGRRSEPETFIGKEQTDSVAPACDTSPTKQTVKDKLVEILSPRKAKSPSPETSRMVKLPTQTSPKQNEICYRYYCIPCKIKFSSTGNLKAHKEFYCPHGKDNEMTMVVKEPVNDETERDTRSPVDEGMLYQCDGCETEFSSSRLLKLHFCTRLSTAVPLLRCPYCDYVTQTENRLSEHMKVHIPTKAFKCTICGYRGNTARGMRMHGKMHVENGEEFTDDNMLEYEEPPVVPIQRNGVCDKGPITMETELIRMKNEPYKRRRSRKSFEKSENIPPFLGQGLLPQLCPACGQAFSGISEFLIHLRMHEIAALEAMKSLKSLKCEHCSDYVADSLTSLLAHTQIKHPEQLPSTSKSENSHSESEGERSQSRDSQRTHDNRSRSNSVESSRASNSVSSHEHITSDQIKSENVDANSRSDQHKCELSGNKHMQLRVKTETISSEDQVSPVLKSETSPTYRSDTQKDLKENGQDTNHCHDNSENSKSPIRSVNHENSTTDAVSTATRSPSNKMSPPSEQVIKRSPRQQLSPHQVSPLTSHPLRSSPWHALLGNINLIKQEHVLSHKILTDDIHPNLPPQSSQHANSEQRSPSIHESSPSPTKSQTSLSPKSSNSPHPKIPLVPPSLPLLYNPQAMLSLYQLPGGIPNPLASAAMAASGAAALNGSPDKNGHKYCKHCDINFTYLSSFLTHKKFYCSARTSTDDLSPTASA